MPKIKSHSSAKKRFTKTASGKWKHRKAGRRHLLTNKSAKSTKADNVLGSEMAESKLLNKFLPYK
ncbi:MAG: 50S ribosomal protein L35 [Elusimicrobiaceae bacterium]